jgi:hypothetical protein
MYHGLAMVFLIVTLTFCNFHQLDAVLFLVGALNVPINHPEPVQDRKQQACIKPQLEVMHQDLWELIVVNSKLGKE